MSAKRGPNPAPWEAEPVRPDGHVWITSRTDPEFNEFVIVAEVAPWNAPLIAAAPDLLSLAQRWAALDGGAWNVQRYAREKAELMADTEAAIAKVTGEDA